MGADLHSTKLPNPLQPTGRGQAQGRSLFPAGWSHELQADPKPSSSAGRGTRTQRFPPPNTGSHWDGTAFLPFSLQRNKPHLGWGWKQLQEQSNSDNLKETQLTPHHHPTATLCSWKQFPFSCSGKGSPSELGGEEGEEEIFYL